MPANVPGTGLIVYRKPHVPEQGLIYRRAGVERRSERVKAQNLKFAEVMTGKNIPGACKQPADMPPGRKYKAFKACLFVKGKQAFGKTI